MWDRSHQGLAPHVAHATPHGHAAAASARRHGPGGRGQLHAYLDRVQRLAHVHERHGAGAPADQTDQRRRRHHRVLLLVRRQELVNDTSGYRSSRTVCDAARRHIRSRFFPGEQVAGDAGQTMSAVISEQTIDVRTDGPAAMASRRSFE